MPPRLLGLDYGARRIGVAVSDPLGLTAQPVLTLVRKNLRQDLKSLGRLLRKFGCSAIVVGNPLYLSGDLSPQAARTQAFADTLREAFALPVHLWDERLTSAEAHRHLDAAGRARTAHREVVDQVAAVLILQSFLDAQRPPAASYNPERDSTPALARSPDRGVPIFTVIRSPPSLRQGPARAPA